MLDYCRIFSLIKSPTRKQWQLRPLWSRSNNVVSLQWKKKKIECLLRKYHRDAGHIFWSKKRRRCWEKTSIHRGKERPKAKRGLKFGGGEELCGGPCIKRAGRVLEPPAAAARQTEISCSLFIPHQPEQVLSAGQSAAPANTCPLRFLQDADRWSRSTSCCASVRVSQARQHKYANATKSEEERVD